MAEPDLVALPEGRSFNAEPPPAGLAPARPAADVGRALRALLTRNGVDPRVQEWLFVAGCNSVARFSNWVDKREELQSAVLSKTPLAADNAQLAALKQAWREAEAENARSLTRAHSQASNEELDTPLEPSLQKEVETNFRRLYSWPALPASRVGSDSLLGRVQREFARLQPSQFPVSRVKSLASVQRGPPAKVRRLSAGLTLHLSGPEEGEEHDEPAGLHEFWTQLNILATTWAVAGCFEAEGGEPVGSKTVFCHWAEACSYTAVFEDRSYAELPAYTEESVVNWATSVEHAVRTRAIELVRGTDKLRWGHALTVAVRDLSTLWSECRHLLVPRRSPGSVQSAPPPAAGKGTGKGASGPPNQPAGPSQRKWRHSNTLPSGAPLCKKFNDRRGCGKNCPDQKAHACDVTLQSGSACGRKDHNRLRHDSARHGAPMTH